MKIASLFVVLILLQFVSCKSKQEKVSPETQREIHVTAYKVGGESVMYHDEYPGTVQALDEVEIRPQVSGNITGIFFKDGQHVTKGQKLYTIDQQLYRGTYEQSVANLNVAKANLERAQQDADRYNALAKKDAIARQTVEHALADLQAAKMQVEAAQANVSSVATNLRYSVITSPLNGTIGISQVKVGAAVAPGQSILNTVSSDNPMAVDFSVTQSEIARFTALRENRDRNDSTFTLLLADGSRYPVSGHIELIDRAVDPQTGTIKTRLVFQNDRNLLKPGMTVTVRVLNRSKAGEVVIPNKAVTEQLGEFFVYVVADSNKVSQRKIVEDKPVGTDIIVRSGLQPGEVIVTQGIQNLREGSSIIVDSMVVK